MPSAGDGVLVIRCGSRGLVFTVPQGAVQTWLNLIVAVVIDSLRDPRFSGIEGLCTKAVVGDHLLLQLSRLHGA